MVLSLDMCIVKVYTGSLQAQKSNSLPLSQNHLVTLIRTLEYMEHPAWETLL